MIGIFDTISKQSLPRVLAVEIICGDCAGDDLLPQRTNLTGDGRCAVCGGRSFVPASRLCDALARHLQNLRKTEVNKDNEQSENSQTRGNYIEISESIRH